ncbi:MAG: hypothetical protein ABFC90_00585 [Bacteroidales bacterium]
MKDRIVLNVVLILGFCVNLFAQGSENSTINPQSFVEKTNINLYPSTPYQMEGAGYNGVDVTTFKRYKEVVFMPKGVGNVTDELNTLIDKLSKAGGGKIIISKGNYIIKEVVLKSNIQIIIETGVNIVMDNGKSGKQMLFEIGTEENMSCVENVRLIGLGSPENRPKLILNKYVNTFYRAIDLGYAKNVLIENFTVVDHLTKGAAIAFNPVKINANSANIPENITVSNVSLTGGSIGYGLVQTNVGENILLKNLYCQGGMTCRIESHTGRRYDVGVDNIVIKNVVSQNGKAAVLLQPHSVENGRILVDGATSVGSTWTLFIKEGFVSKESKRKVKGSFAASSTFKNITLISTDSTATLSYKNFKYVPDSLKGFYKNPDFKPVKNDANYQVENGEFSAESAVVGASIAAIFIDATYPLNLPTETEIILTGKIANRLKILKTTKY